MGKIKEPWVNRTIEEQGPGNDKGQVMNLALCRAVFQISDSSLDCKDKTLDFRLIKSTCQLSFCYRNTIHEIINLKEKSLLGIVWMFILMACCFDTCG